jgi:hypothetical protein
MRVAHVFAPVTRLDSRTPAGASIAVQCFAIGGPVRHGVARSAVPARVSAAALAEAGGVPLKALDLTQLVAVRQCVGDRVIQAHRRG